MKNKVVFFMLNIILIMLLGYVKLSAQQCWNPLDSTYTMGFEDKDTNDLKLWKFDDNNNDDWTWIKDNESTWFPHSGNYVIDTWIYGDWVFSRCFNLEGNKRYKMSFWYMNWESDNNQNLLIAFGDTILASEMKDTIANIKNIKTKHIYKNAEFVFKSTNDGNFYFGWLAYGYSDGAGTIMSIDDIEIKEFQYEVNLGYDTTICAGASIQLDAGDGFASYKWNDEPQLNSRYLTVSSAGQYSVEAISKFGDIVKDTINISVYTLPADSLLVINENNEQVIDWAIDICNNQSITLKAQIDDTLSNYTIKWYNDNYYFGTGDSIIAEYEGNYYYKFKNNQYGCEDTSTYNLDVTIKYPYEYEQISHVTVDESGKNAIKWVKTSGENIQSYIIYKESTVTSVYDSIGIVPYVGENCLSFTDINSNPEQMAARYRIQVVDSCDNRWEMSDAHKTIHLNINLAPQNKINLMWDNYEGFYYETYFILRDTVPDIAEDYDHIIGVIQSSLSSFTDLEPYTDHDNYYKLGVENPNTNLCNPQIGKKSADPKHRLIFSNKVSSKGVGINEPVAGLFDLKLYPNPTYQLTIINYQLTINSKVLIKLYDITGREIRTIADEELIQGEHKHTVDLSGLYSGIYFVKINVDGFDKMMKVVKY